jgi:hypothetical protein
LVPRAPVARVSRRRRSILRVEALEDRVTPSNIGIVTNPQPQTANAGQSVTFSASATGSPAPAVQWQVSTNGSAFRNIPGATSDTLKLTDLTAAQNNNEYLALFTNGTGDLASAPAKLTVDYMPKITQQPVNQTVAVSSPVELTAAADANPGAAAQWYSSTDGTTFNLIVGATSADYSFTAPSSTGIEYYRVFFSNTLGSQASNAATLMVDAPPSVTTNPSHATVNAGAAATFSATAIGPPTPKVQWQKSVDGGPFTNIPGATLTTLSVPGTQSEDGEQFRAMFTNAFGTTDSNPATLTVHYAPEITKEPASQTVMVNRQVDLTAAANANPAATAQWYSSTDDKVFHLIDGATSADYSFTAPATPGVEYFSVKFSNGLGSQRSNVATLTINAPPSVTSNPSAATVNAGGIVTFAAQASGAPRPSVQWQQSMGGAPFTNIPGMNGLILAFIPTPAMNGNQYRAVFTNAYGTADSSPATLTVNYAPHIILQPTSQTVMAGT